MKRFLNRETAELFSIDRTDYSKMVKAIGPDPLEKKYGGNMRDDLPMGRNLLAVAEQFNEFFQGEFALKSFILLL
jgi:hypothetical protein